MEIRTCPKLSYKETAECIKIKETCQIEQVEATPATEQSKHWLRKPKISSLAIMPLPSAKCLVW